MSYTVATENNDSTIIASNSTSALFKFKTFISSTNLWSVKSCGDGLSYINSVSDGLTTSSSGAQGFGNSRAWLVLSNATGSGGSLCFQRGSSDNQFRVKYSPSVGFTSGGSSDTTPSASDEKVLLGSGTDASPTFASLFRTSGSQLKCHFLCDPIAGSWVMFGNAFSQNTISFLHVFEKIQNTNSQDAHPYVILLDGQDGSPSGAAGSVASLNGNSGKLKAYLNKGDATNEYFGDIQAFDLSIDGKSILADSNYSLPSSPYTSKDGTMPVIYAKRANSTPSFPSGIKGQSSVLRWHLQNGRSTYSVFSVKTSQSSSQTENRIVVGNLSLPWDDSSVSW